MALFLDEHEEEKMAGTSEPANFDTFTAFKSDTDSVIRRSFHPTKYDDFFFFLLFVLSRT